MNHRPILSVLALLAATSTSFAGGQYESPDAAFAALAKASATGDKAAVAAVLGADSAAILQDETSSSLQEFGKAYEAYHEILTEGEQRLIQVGELGYFLPIPVISSDGKWSFDLKEAAVEIRERRIGRNELTAIETLRAYVSAQRAYAAEDHDGDKVFEYAQRLISSKGQRDGLYFETEPGEPESPFGPLVSEKAEYLKDKTPGDPYYGYHFKILRSQGDAAPGGAYDYVINDNMIAGFAMLAWPAEYGNTGIMSFIVSHQGQVYDRDLGKDTATTAQAMTSYQPEAGWSAVPADGVDETTLD